MASVLYIEEAVVTGDVLSRRHADQEQVCIDEGAIVTPTGWDYLRQKRLSLSRGKRPAPAVQAEQAPAQLIAEVQAPQMDGMGRCDRPDHSCGCQTEEFGSGYVEPSSCRDCAIYQMKSRGESGASCHGCNRRALLDQLIESGQGVEPEQLIGEVTALVVDRLED